MGGGLIQLLYVHNNNCEQSKQHLKSSENLDKFGENLDKFFFVYSIILNLCQLIV
jgi:hypothetical protein